MAFPPLQALRVRSLTFRRVATLGALLLSFASPAPAQQSAISGADILSAPFVPELSASPAGRRV